MNGGRKLATVAALVALATVTAGFGPAHATRNTVADPDDSASPVDLASASHGHTNVDGRRLITHRVDAHAPWADDVGGRHTAIYFAFDVDGDGSGDYFVSVSEARGTLRASADFDARVRVTRPDADSVQIAFPKSAIAGRGDGYHWNASIYYDPARGDEPIAGCEEGCSDAAPDAGAWIHHGAGRHGC
ncbi:MAG TPA: hypothetical protein VHJ34_03345 [Actinomycetota bacterium]|nr:hypothetical protein [Actinomycetota bacterium]